MFGERSFASAPYPAGYSWIPSGTGLVPANRKNHTTKATSVMATHDHDTLDRALAMFAEAKRGFEAEHGPLQAPV